jgi:hypothetical protein
MNDKARKNSLRFFIALFSLLLIAGAYRLGYQAGTVEERSWNKGVYQPYYNNVNFVRQRFSSRENVRAVGNVNIVRQVSAPLRDSYPFNGEQRP